MTYNFQKEFFLVHDLDTEENKLFHLWNNVVLFLTDEIMRNGYYIILDETEWRAPKNREECFDLLFNMKNTEDLNDFLERLWYVELIEFSD